MSTKDFTAAAMKAYRPDKITVSCAGNEVARLLRLPAAPGGKETVLIRRSAAFDAMRVAPALSGVAPWADGPVGAALPDGLLSGTFTGFPGWLADALPDTWGRRVLSRFIADRLMAENHFEAEEDRHSATRAGNFLSEDLLTLLAFVGRDAPCGLDFVPEHASSHGAPAILNLAEAAREARALDVRASLTGCLPQLRGGWSAGGARPKMHVGISTSGEMFAGCGVADLCEQGLEPWLFKFGHDTTKYRAENQAGRIEYAYYLMAKDCGIEMSESRPIQGADGVGNFLTRRFDRSASSRLALRSLAGLLNLDKSRSVSYENQWLVRRDLLKSDAGGDQFFTRAAFNVIASVRDDHGGNFGFLRDSSGEWSQSPAFDVTLCNSETHHATITGRNKDISRENLMAFADRIGLPSAVARDILGRVIGTVHRWPEYAARACVNASMTKDVALDINIAGRLIEGVKITVEAIDQGVSPDGKPKEKKPPSIRR